MENIIHYTETFLTIIYKKIEAGITDVDELASSILEDCKELSRNIVQEIIIQINEGLRKDKQTRKELGLTLKEKDRPRVLLTKLGELKYSRDCYYNKKTKHHETPLDKMISVEQYTRVGDAVSAELVALATEMSYAKSSKIVTGGQVSRQTVKNQIQRAPLLEKQIEERERKVEILEVYADEDHVHMQKPNKEKGKKNKMVPLVTVSEGVEKASKNRNRIINPMHFVDEKFDGKTLWESVEGYIEKTYDLEMLEEIRIHGDGGKWIKKGLENFGEAKHVMDGYHAQKRIKQLDKRFSTQHVQKRINEAIRKKDFNEIKKILSNLYDICIKENRGKQDSDAIEEMYMYLKGNWEAVINRYEKGMTGSCTEGQVSHVLSERFSRNPMGWSEEGLGKLTKLRVYRKNGGEITSKHFKKNYEINETYRKYAKESIEKVKSNYDFSWINDMREQYIPDTTSGTQQAIRNLGRIRDNFLN